MISTISLILSFTFLLLGLIHLYWSIGGQWGFDNSLPTNVDGERVLNPKKTDSAIVGLGLLFFSAFYLIKIDVIQLDLPNWAAVSAGWFISSIFLLRSVGDFKYVGFTKKVKSTEFGKADAKFYSPLCLFIGILGITIELI